MYLYYVVLFFHHIHAWFLVIDNLYYFVSYPSFFLDSPRTNNNRHEPCYDNSTPRFNAPPFKPRSAWDSCSSSTTSEELVRPGRSC